MLFTFMRCSRCGRMKVEGEESDVLVCCHDISKGIFDGMMDIEETWEVSQENLIEFIKSKGRLVRDQSEYI